MADKIYEDLDEVNMFFVGQSLSLDGRISMFAVVSFFLFCDIPVVAGKWIFVFAGKLPSFCRHVQPVHMAHVHIFPLCCFFPKTSGSLMVWRTPPCKNNGFPPKKSQPEIDAGQELFAILNIDSLIFWVPNFDPYPHSKWHSVGSSFRPGSAALVTYCFRGPAWYGFSTVI